jgi:uncharacterized membrane protein YesL
MKVDPESPPVQGLTTFLAFVVLNLLYLMTCLPVVTIGVATSALYEVTFRYADEERGNLLRDYIAALRRNAAQATAVFAALGLPLAALLFAAVFWSALGGALSVAATIIAVLAAAYLLAALLYGLALVASYRNSLRQTLKNALLLPGAEPLWTLGILLVPVTCVALLVAMPGFVYLIATIGFSVGAYASAFLFRRVFRGYAGTVTGA